MDHACRAKSRCGRVARRSRGRFVAAFWLFSMTPLRKHQAAMQDRVTEVTDQLLRHVRDEERLAVIKAPPGSGKTHLLLTAAEEALKRKQRVAIATQTNSQADDICRRLVLDFKLTGIRFVGSGG